MRGLTKILLYLLTSIVVLCLIFFILIKRNCKTQNEFDLLVKQEKLLLFSSRCKFYESHGAKSTTRTVKYYDFNGVLQNKSYIWPCNYWPMFFGDNPGCVENIDTLGTYVIYDYSQNYVMPVFTKAQFELLMKYFPDSAKLLDQSILCK